MSDTNIESFDDYDDLETKLKEYPVAKIICMIVPLYILIIIIIKRSKDIDVNNAKWCGFFGSISICFVALASYCIEAMKRKDKTGKNYILGTIMGIICGIGCFIYAITYLLKNTT